MTENIAEIKAENERLKSALEPSDETKKAYMSEFKMPVVFWEEDESGHVQDVVRDQNVPWVTIKEIMQAIRQKAGLK